LNTSCSTPGCGHDHHAHSDHDHKTDKPFGTHDSVFPGVAESHVVPFEDATTIDSARRILMHRAGRAIPFGDTPDMTVREGAMPEGILPIEIGSMIVEFSDDTPPTRARLTNALRTATGLTGLKPQRDANDKYWRWDMNVTTTIDFAVALVIWKVAATSRDVAYARLDGIFEKGIWVLESHPASEDKEDVRFIVSGVADDHVEGVTNDGRGGDVVPDDGTD
jgi:hypothetical protein